VNIRLSVIGYRDYTDKNRFMLKPFIENIKEVRDFMKTFRAGNNATLIDPPEDIQGALKLMLM